MQQKYIEKCFLKTIHSADCMCYVITLTFIDILSKFNQTKAHFYIDMTQTNTLDMRTMKLKAFTSLCLSVISETAFLIKLKFDILRGFFWDFLRTEPNYFVESLNIYTIVNTIVNTIVSSINSLMIKNSLKYSYID